METKRDDSIDYPITAVPGMDDIKNDLDRLFACKNYSQVIAHKGAEDLLAKFERLTNQDEKYCALIEIGERFQREKSKNDAQLNEFIGAIKNALINQINNRTVIKGLVNERKPYLNWKDALLKIDENYQPLSHTFLEPKRVYPDIAYPIALTNEQRFHTARRMNGCTISGSSFASNNEEKLQALLDDSGQLKEAVILDASYTASVSDGWVIAIADGCGHRKEDRENEDIGRTSYFAAKNACRLMAGFKDADSLTNNLIDLKKRLSSELPVKVRAHRDLSLQPKRIQEPLEKTTLACGRAFKMDNDHFRFVGLNIGDSMLIAYNPRKKTFATIARAQQILRGWGKGSPAALPDLCKDDQIVTFDLILEKETIVFGLTDGVWDYLPVLQNSAEDQEQKGKIDTEIDFKTLMADPNFKLPHRVTVSRLTKSLADYSILQTELERLSRLKIAKEAPLAIFNSRIELTRLQQAGKDAYHPEIRVKANQLEDAIRSLKVEIGDDYTLVGLQLTDNIDLTPDYTAGEIAVSILTLGLYALIKDCLHIGTDDKITLTDGLGAAAATLGFFASCSFLGLGYLACKGIQEFTYFKDKKSEGLVL
ncbi:MAG: hypothetical protein H0U70_08035 [Tatlockia sp.]|nr:hypothetical protein [Tatlockia sp.]